MKFTSLLMCFLMACIMPFLTSCQTVANPDGTPGKEVDYTFLAQTATTLAVTKVLSKATDEDDKTKKAEVIDKVATALLVATNEKTTGADINALVISIAGNKDHWLLLGAALSVAYDRYSPTVPYATLIQAIATAAKTSAAAA